MEKLQTHIENPNNNQSKRITCIVAALFSLTGCSLNIYNYDNYDVRCDGRVAVADFENDSHVTFITKNIDNEEAALIVTKGNDKYTYHVQSLIGENPSTPTVIGPIASDGNSNPDFYYEIQNNEWGVNVLTDQNTVIVTGYCD